MAIPDFQTLMLPTLRLLAQRRWRTADLVARLSDEFGLTAEERASRLPSGRQATIANRTHWSLAYLGKSGLTTRISRGEYEASEAGRELLRNPPDRITLPFLVERYPGARAFRGETEAGPAPAAQAPAAAQAAAGAETPRERIERAAAELRAAVASDLLDQLRRMHPDAFERLIVDLLLAMGFGGSRKDAGERLGRTGDGGIDGIIRQDALGLDAVFIQAKRYAEDSPVSAPAIRGRMRWR